MRNRFLVSERETPSCPKERWVSSQFYLLAIPGPISLFSPRWRPIAPSTFIFIFDFQKPSCFRQRTGKKHQINASRTPQQYCSFCQCFNVSINALKSQLQSTVCYIKRNATSHLPKTGFTVRWISSSRGHATAQGWVQCSGLKCDTGSVHSSVSPVWTHHDTHAAVKASSGTSSGPCVGKGAV